MTSGQALKEIPLFIGGSWVSTSSTREIRLPFDGTPIALASEGDLDTVQLAIQEAERGAYSMAALSNAERSDLLLRTRTILERDADEFAKIVCVETGKPIQEARAEVERAQQTLLECAIAARDLRGEVVPIDASPAGKGRMAMTVREPLGVIVAITPFNMPLNLALHKIGPALAGGNAVVHKPSESTPLSALRLARSLEEAGVPAGAYNIVTGDGPAIGQALVRDPRVRMISFTGSAAVGKEIRAAAGLKRVTLELGGNSALILEPDADMELAVGRAVTGAFSNSGQVCISVQRILVHESIASEFLQRFGEAASKLKMGHPLDETTDISSLINEPEAVRVEEWIADAVTHGATVALGGNRTGATVPPTILTNSDPAAKISCNEVFGPVVAVDGYRDLRDAVRYANNTPYGLQAGIFTRDLQTAFSAARSLRVGGVMINDIPTFRVDGMPYGGTKESGLGREGPRYAIDEMTDTKLICWR